MNELSPGFLIGMLLGGAAVGAIAGLVPLFLGVRRNRTWLAVGGFFASVAAGLATGIIGASVVAGVFSYIIRTRQEPATEESTTSPDLAQARTALGWFVVVMFFGQTLFGAVFWSLFMSVWLGKSFVSILIPAGAGFGLTMGIFMTAMMAVVLRSGTVRVDVLDREDFLTRLDRAAGKLRYRPFPDDQGTIAYEPRTLLRNAATRIMVEIHEAEAVMTGPKMTLDRLKKEIQKP
jgi:hypothetical protein